MMLRKEKWEFVQLEKLSHGIEYGITAGSDDSGNAILLRITDINENGRLNEGLRFTTVDEKTYDKYKLKWGNVLIARSGATAGKPYIHKSNDRFIFASYLLRILLNEEKIDPDYFFSFLNSPNYLLQLTGIKVGSAQPNVNTTNLSTLKVPLPSLEEQKQIASLFQSIETAMEQMEGQEKNLKALWKRLVDEFVSDKPTFGKLLKDKKLKTVNYCDVTEKLMRKIDPLTCGILRIVAGENLESKDFKIRTWQKVGEGYLGPAFHVLFKEGDILYGSRRTYLRKVSLADFEGVCANTTYVIRAKEEILLQDLLKHIMLSEKFTQYSIGVSKGSTNPYINWKDLDNFSFQIPDIQVQREVVKVLDDLIGIIEQLKEQRTILRNLKQKLLTEILG